MTPRAAVAVLLGVGALTTGCTKTLDVVGLRPLSPPATDPLHVVSTPSPELRWESFPRPRDGKVFGPDASRRITDVTYEIRLWRDPFDGMQSDTPADLHGVEHPPVATGLTQAKFVPPPPLKRGQYRWTVRARFRLDGQPRATQWSHVVVGMPGEFQNTVAADIQALSFAVK